jgi:hypothetical protein
LARTFPEIEDRGDFSYSPIFKTIFLEDIPPFRSETTARTTNCPDCEKDFRIDGWFKATESLSWASLINQP